MKREVAAPLILKHLLQRPHDSAKEVAVAVECSVGVVVESDAWKANQSRLRIAAQEGRDPKAVRLNLAAVNESGGGGQPQRHASREDEAARDDAIDRHEETLFGQIGEYIRQNPAASTKQIVLAVKCSAGDVERWRATVGQLAAEQDESAGEDDGGKLDDKAKTSRDQDKRRRWVKRNP
jgi:hypothetical protein